MQETQDKTGGWREDLRRVVLQDPLVETRLSLDGLEGPVQGEPPKAIFIGLGICSRQKLSQGLPLDLLGMLLPAQRAQRAMGARDMVVLVADSHALSNRFNPDDVARQAEQVVATLEQIKQRLGLDPLTVVRASTFNADPDYAQTHALVREQAPAQADNYVTREVADIVHLQRKYGDILKVGWTISASADVCRACDELAFDHSFRTWTGRPLWAIYCKAGHALDDAQPKVSPYVTVDDERRICLREDEDVAARLARGRALASPATVRAVRNHLRAITRAYSQQVKPLTGPVEQRTQQVLSHLWGGHVE